MSLVQLVTRIHAFAKASTSSALFLHGNGSVGAPPMKLLKHEDPTLYREVQRYGGIKKVVHDAQENKAAKRLLAPIAPFWPSPYSCIGSALTQLHINGAMSEQQLKDAIMDAGHFTGNVHARSPEGHTSFSSFVKATMYPASPRDALVKRVRVCGESGGALALTETGVTRAEPVHAHLHYDGKCVCGMQLVPRKLQYVRDAEHKGLKRIRRTAPASSKAKRMPISHGQDEARSPVLGKRKAAPSCGAGATNCAVSDLIGSKQPRREGTARVEVINLVSPDSTPIKGNIGDRASVVNLCSSQSSPPHTPPRRKYHCSSTLTPVTVTPAETPIKLEGQHVGVMSKPTGTRAGNVVTMEWEQFTSRTERVSGYRLHWEFDNCQEEVQAVLNKMGTMRKLFNGTKVSTPHLVPPARVRCTVKAIGAKQSLLATSEWSDWA